MSDLLLDTCAIIWIGQGAGLNSEAQAALVEHDVYVSPISAWEIANLVRKNRLALTSSVSAWFRQLVEKAEAVVPQLTMELLVSSCFLPGNPPNDPADRILIATAREADLAILTRDAAILAYARAGHVRSLAC